MDLTRSHDLFKYDKTINKPERYTQEVSVQKLPLINLNGLPPPNCHPIVDCHPNCHPNCHNFSISHPIVDSP